MRIGFTGAHRSGKTTLARALARIYKIPLLPSQASATIARHKFDYERDNRLDTGMAMQTEQIAEMLVRLSGAQGSFVSDRTPLDAAAYLLADATNGAGNESTRAATVIYVENCIRDTARFFDIVILVPPAITFEPVDGKPPVNQAYQEHHHQICRGLMFDEGLEHMRDRMGQIMRENIVLADRVEAALNFVDKALPRFPILQVAA